jgi:hypothetical protein
MTAPPTPQTTGRWRNGHVVDGDGRPVVVATSGRLFVRGADLDDAFPAFWQTAAPWPRLVLTDLDSDAHVERAEALLSQWPAGAGSLELQATDGRLPALSCIPPAVTTLRLCVDRSAQLDLCGLPPARGDRTVVLSCAAGQVDLRPLRSDDSLVDVDLRCKVRGLETVATWPRLERLRAPAQSGLGPLTGADGAGPPALNTLVLFAMAAVDLGPLAALQGLRQLTLSGLKNDDVSALRGLPLRALSLGGMAKLKDLTTLAGLDDVDHLRLSGVKGLTSLAGLETLPALHTLTVANALTALVDVSAIARHDRLYTLAIDAVEPVRARRALLRVGLDRGLALIDGDGAPLG